MNEQLEDYIKYVSALLLGNLIPDGAVIKKEVTDYLAALRPRMTQLAQGIIDKQLTYDFVVSRMRDEAENLKLLLLSILQIAEAEAQDIANLAIMALESFLKKQVP